MSKPIHPPDELPPELTWHTDDDVRSAWAVIWDRRDQIHDVLALKFAEQDPERLRKVVDSCLDLLVLSADSFTAIAQQWKDLDEEGTIQRLVEANGRVV